jgi:hypothetical protein
MLSRLIPHLIDPQSLGKAVQCNMIVSTHNRLTGQVISPQSKSLSYNANIYINFVFCSHQVDRSSISLLHITTL